MTHKELSDIANGLIECERYGFFPESNYKLIVETIQRAICHSESEVADFRDLTEVDLVE